MIMLLQESLNLPLRKQPPELSHIPGLPVVDHKFLQHLHLVWLPERFRIFFLLKNLFLLQRRPVLKVLVGLLRSRLVKGRPVTVMAPLTEEKKVIQTLDIPAAGADSGYLQEK